jgi:hypothetical protein
MPRYKRKSSALSTKKGKRMNKQGDVTTSQNVDFSDVSSIEERAVEDAVEDEDIKRVFARVSSLCGRRKKKRNRACRYSSDECGGGRAISCSKCL